MAETPVLERTAEATVLPRRSDAALTFTALARTIALRWRVFTAIVAGLLLACLGYCLIATPQYEARAQLALRRNPATTLFLDGAQTSPSSSLASGPMQLETMAGVIRSDELAWRVIVDLRLYREPAFTRQFARRFPTFDPNGPEAAAQVFLLERFHDRLRVRTIPRTFLMEVRFRSGDGKLSAQVVQALLDGYAKQQTQARMEATRAATASLGQQLAELKARSDQDQRRLAEFQRRRGLLIAPDSIAGESGGELQHGSVLAEVDDLEHELAQATEERIAREAQYRAALEGDPEAVLSADSRLQTDNGGVPALLFRQIHARQSDLRQEAAQLSLEHGPNFPRVLEIRQELDDLDHQLTAEDARLRERFKSGWRTAQRREELLRRTLAERTGEGQRISQAANEYEAMRREAQGTQQLRIHMQEKVTEAGLAADLDGSDLEVVDPPRVPAKPSSPNLGLYLGLTLFIALWIALGVVLLMDNFRARSAASVLAILLLLCCAKATAQAPTPSTSGLPTGVARVPAEQDRRAPASPKDAPAVWNAGAPGEADGLLPGAPVNGMVAPIAAGDLLDVSEFRTPEFRATVRVSPGGVVLLPMIGEVSVQGLDESAAARAIAATLVARGILLHPEVSVLVRSYVGQDVSVLGEVVRPGVYAYGVHHRLLDLISAAQGLSPAAASMVTIYHRTSAAQAISMVDGTGADAPDHNPELLPGDVVRVSRAGLVYVVGDVLRPGGFTMEPVQSMTVLRALSLAWGPSANAALKKAVLIREQKGGRTVTILNLKRMLRGQDPDMEVREHDILFVPDSAAKNLWNRTMESVVQSTAGVSIYAGMVYSQRF